MLGYAMRAGYVVRTVLRVRCARRVTRASVLRRCCRFARSFGRLRMRADTACAGTPVQFTQIDVYDNKIRQSRTGGFVARIDLRIRTVWRIRRIYARLQWIEGWARIRRCACTVYAYAARALRMQTSVYLGVCHVVSSCLERVRQAAMRVRGTGVVRRLVRCARARDRRRMRGASGYLSDGYSRASRARTRSEFTVGVAVAMLLHACNQDNGLCDG